MGQPYENIVIEHLTSLWIPSLYRVRQKREENDSIVSLLVEPTSSDRQLDPIRAGQFNMLYVFGKGEIPVSISSLAFEHPQMVHTIQDVGKISAGLCELNPGDCLGIRGPFGNTWPLQAAEGKDVLLVAGGLGLAPLRPVIEHIVLHRHKFKQVNILYGTRSPDYMTFHKDIIAWQADPDINFLLSVDHSFKTWRGHVGVVTHLIEQVEFDPDNVLAMVCGPEIMMRYAFSTLGHAGVKAADIYLSMERNMKCAIGHCGHCQFGPAFICKDGPVFQYSAMEQYLNVKEL